MTASKRIPIFGTPPEALYSFLVQSVNHAIFLPWQGDEFSIQQFGKGVMESKRLALGQTSRISVLDIETLESAGTNPPQRWLEHAVHVL